MVPASAGRRINLSSGGTSATGVPCRRSAWFQYVNAVIAAIAGVSLDPARADLSAICHVRSLLVFVSVTGRHRFKRDR